MRKGYAKRDSSSSNIGILDVFQIVFIVLKFAGLIDWPWYQVFMPTLIMAVGVILLLTLWAFDQIKQIISKRKQEAK